MELIDQFAMSVTLDQVDSSTPQSVKGCAEYIGITEEEYNPTIHWPKVIAKAKYVIANEMLIERESWINKEVGDAGVAPK